jgi:hypothetical protein
MPGYLDALALYLVLKTYRPARQTVPSVIHTPAGRGKRTAAVPVDATSLTNLSIRGN